MPNEKNLKRPSDYLTPEEIHEKAVAMGKASGKARRKRANIRKTMAALLTAPSSMSLKGETLTYEEAMCYQMLAEVIEKRNVYAFRAIMAAVGETGKSDLDIEEQKARIKVMKTLPETAGVADDGFMAALNATAAEDWADETDAV